jgi:SAM-dependent methyltransferase
MHEQAMAWVAQFATEEPLRILALGDRDINVTVRPLFPGAAYMGLDIMAGPGVDIVADAATWDPGEQRWDTVLATELFEHAPEWPAICRTAFRALEPGGRFIVTTAAPGRPPHSGIDGGPLKFGEFYSNIDPAGLRAALEAAGFVEITVDVQPSPADVRAVAIKPKSSTDNQEGAPA